eukprot:2694309-Rhodomonas_salina.2
MLGQDRTSHRAHSGGQIQTLVQYRTLRSKRVGRQATFAFGPARVIYMPFPATPHAVSEPGIAEGPMSGPIVALGVTWDFKRPDVAVVKAAANHMSIPSMA